MGDTQDKDPGVGDDRLPNCSAVSRVFQRYNLEWIAVTAGGEASELYARDGRRWEFILPRLQRGA